MMTAAALPSVAGATRSAAVRFDDCDGRSPRLRPFPPRHSSNVDKSAVRRCADASIRSAARRSRSGIRSGRRDCRASDPYGQPIARDELAPQRDAARTSVPSQPHGIALDGRVAPDASTVDRDVAIGQLRQRRDASASRTSTSR